MNLPIKYRPQSFEDVTGQEHVTKTLQNALAQKKISSAYLLSGPRGIGKTTIARIFAKGLNCEKGITPNPCNRCHACLEIQGSRSLDVLEIDGASNRGIDDVRELREKILYAPPTGRFRVVIIDEVHMLSVPAFNALLKTLEEPPPHVVFIFATTEPQKVPETVLSRTLRFDLRPLTEEQIMERTREIAGKEGIRIAEDALSSVAEHARGSLRDALVLLEQLTLFAEKGEVKKEHVLKLLGIVDEALYLRILTFIKEKRLREIFDLLDREVFQRGIPPEIFTSGLSKTLEKMLAAKVGILEGSLKSLKEISERFSVPDIMALMSISFEMERELRHTMMPRVWITYFLAKMAHLPSYLRVQEILEKAGITLFEEEAVLEDVSKEVPKPKEEEELLLEERKEEVPVSATTGRKVSQEEQRVPEALSSDEVVDRLLSVLTEKFPLVGSILSRARFQLQNGTLKLEVEDPFQMDFLEDHREDIEVLMKEVSENLEGIEITMRERKDEERREDVWLKRLVEDFDMEVIEGV